MLHLLKRTIELEKLIDELQNCTATLDKESSAFNNAETLIKIYSIEKAKIEEVINCKKHE